MLNTIIKAMLVGKKAVDLVGKMPNIKAPTMGGKVFWHDLESKNGYRLQKNSITGHCRIIDSDDTRKTWGSEAAMRAEFVEIAD